MLGEGQGVRCESGRKMAHGYGLSHRLRRRCISDLGLGRYGPCSTGVDGVEDGEWSGLGLSDMQKHVTDTDDEKVVDLWD